MKSFSKYGFFILLLFAALLVHSQGGEAASASITFEEAIQWGFEHSPTFKSLTDSMTVNNLTIERLKSTLGWNLSLAGDASYGKMGIDLGQLGGIMANENEATGQWGLALQGSKNFLWGLILQSKVSVKDDFSFSRLDDTVNLTLSATQQVFPRIVIKAEEELYSAQNTLAKTRLNLTWQMQWKRIDWVEAYLNITRLQERVRLEEQNLELVKATLAQVLAEAKIGEAGEQQVLTAQLSVKQAEYRLLQTTQMLTQKKKAWYQELNLPAEQEVLFTGLTPNLLKMAESHKKISMDLTNPTGLMEKVLSSHYQMQGIRLDQQFARQQLDWHQRPDLPQISAKGNYDYRSDNWSIGINASYNLFDGGQQKVTTSSDEMQIQRLNEEYTNLARSLQLQLETYLNQHELAKLQLEEKRLALEKARLEEKLAKQQFESRVLTEKEYQQKQMFSEQARIDLESAEDALMIAEWRLVYFCGTVNELEGGKSN